MMDAGSSVRWGSPCPIGRVGTWEARGESSLLWHVIILSGTCFRPVSRELISTEGKSGVFSLSTARFSACDMQPNRTRHAAETRRDCRGMNLKHVRHIPRQDIPDARADEFEEGVEVECVMHANALHLLEAWETAR
jgi:hypothetical protein